MPMNEIKTDTTVRQTMYTSQTSRKPHKGPCICDDCGKNMQWEGIGWYITNRGYLLCGLCMCWRVKTSRYHENTREEEVVIAHGSFHKKEAHS